jgi:hypothetical protein
MIWQELVTDRNLTEHEIKHAISKAFNISPKSIFVVDDITEFDVDEQVRVVCERIEMSGDFPMRISIYLRDEQLVPSNSQTMLGDLCDLMKCQCLVSDESPNPYQWLLIQNSKNWRSVYIDPVKLDENEEFSIQSEG